MSYAKVENANVYAYIVLIHLVYGIGVITMVTHQPEVIRRIAYA
jgi:hypothetical protein